MEALGCSKGLDISQKHCQTSFFFIKHTFLKCNCVTVVFVAASGLGAVAFTSQVSEYPLPVGISNSL